MPYNYRVFYLSSANYVPITAHEIITY